MTQAQSDADLCGMIPEENDPGFVAQHLSAYAFMRSRIVGRKVLEVGFGDGYGAAYLAEQAGEVVAVDLVEGNAPRARRKYPRPNLCFLSFDGKRIPFPDRTFDAAGSFQVIEHVPEKDLVAWLTEIRRVLKPEGSFYLSTLNLENARKPGKPYEKLIYHEKEFTAPELKQLLCRIFPSVEMFGLHPSPVHRFFRRLKRWGWKVRAYYSRISVRDFVASRSGLRRCLDLIAVCRIKR